MKPKGKRTLSDKFSRRPQPNHDVRRNPFELFLTKAKHVVAGRNTKPVFDGGVLGKFQKKSKPGQKKQNVQIETQGLRSVSRNAAITNRKNTLLTDYKTRTKSNKVVDRRLGEKDATMTIEDKMMERVMFERKQSSKIKRGAFNLSDDFDEDDDLRFGQTLADVERIEDSDDEKIMEPDDETDDILGEKFVSDHHFGGGLLKKVRTEDAGDKEMQHLKKNALKADRTLLIDDIIAESKQKKYAKQSELDEIRDMTKSLDEKWGDAEVRKLISSTFSQAAPEPPVESYDSLVRMLQFDTKAKASNKLKSDSELAMDAKEELEKAEKKRLKSAQPVRENELELLEPEMDEISEQGNSDEEDIELEEEDEPLIDRLIPLNVDPSAEEKSSEIPFVIPAPEKRKELETLLADRSPEDIVTIVKRIMQYHHISLAEENRGKLTHFFRFLFDFALTYCDERPLEAVQLWNLLTPSLVALVRISASKGLELIRSRLEALSGIVCRKIHYNLVPSAIFFLKFIGLCFPPDYSEGPIVAALNLLLGQILANARLGNRKSLLTSLFVATLATENVLASKKYFPELIRYLQSVLASELQRKDFSTLFTQSKFSIRDVVSVNGSDVEVVSPEDSNKACCLSLGLLEKLVPVYNGLPAYSEIFCIFLELLEQLEKRHSSEAFAQRITQFTELVVLHRQPRQSLAFNKTKPIALTLLEPKIDDKFDRSKSSKKSEIKRLTHDKKRAVKGAKRELRRDNQFIARVQLDEQIKKDATRQKKVKEIFTNLYSQESEHKAMQRQKAKFKI